MTNNPTIDGVSRRTIENALSDAEATRARTSPHIADLRALIDAPDICPTCDSRGGCPDCKPEPEPAQLERVNGHHPACRAVDDYSPGECSHSCAPAVERQEPVAYRVTYNDGEKGPWLNGAPLQIDESDISQGVIRAVECAYSESPDVAALQSTIAQLQARIAELKDGIDKHWKVVCDQRSRIAELESGQGERK